MGSTVTNKNYVAAPVVEWHYEVPQRTDAKMLLLNTGGVAVIGNWYGALGDVFVAWAPLPKRNKAREAELNLLQSPAP